MVAGSGGSETARLLALLFGLAIATGGAAAQPPDPTTRYNELNAAVDKAYQEGQYDRGASLAEEALALARQLVGPRHPATLGSMNNLAFLYERQGRYGEAEPLYAEALQLSREVLGPRHPSTLTSMNNLASLYNGQGRYGEAEPLYTEALQLRREVLGPRHRDTLTSMNTLAFLYERQGRYGEALAVLDPIPERWHPAHPHPLLFRGGNLVADALADDLALELRKGQQNIEGQAPHRGRGIELLRHRNKRRASRIEDLDDLGKIGE
jgi:tetratricopeptide (TPR) repeat protein